MGATYKANVGDIRHSKVIDMVKELEDYSLQVDVWDALVDTNQLNKEQKIKFVQSPIGEYDAIVIAVGHEAYQKFSKTDLKAISKNGEVMLIDINGVMDKHDCEWYWKL